MFASFPTSRLWMTCDRTDLLIVDIMKSGVVIGNLSVYATMFLKHSLLFLVFVLFPDFVLHNQFASSILLMLWPV